ncbi:MAG: PEP-CTERM sorting domain-containing protein [Phycisphaeraceae bacterium]
MSVIGSWKSAIAALTVSVVTVGGMAATATASTIEIGTSEQDGWLYGNKSSVPARGVVFDVHTTFTVSAVDLLLYATFSEQVEAEMQIYGPDPVTGAQVLLNDDARLDIQPTTEGGDGLPSEFADFNWQTFNLPQNFTFYEDHEYVVNFQAISSSEKLPSDGVVFLYGSEATIERPELTVTDATLKRDATKRDPDWSYVPVTRFHVVGTGVPVPEPATAGMFALAGVSLLLRRHRR